MACVRLVGGPKSAGFGRGMASLGARKGDFLARYDKTSSNWPDWYTILADTPILCADGEALTGFKHQPASNKFRYECSRIGAPSIYHIEDMMLTCHIHPYTIYSEYTVYNIYCRKTCVHLMRFGHV